MVMYNKNIQKCEELDGLPIHNHYTYWYPYIFTHVINIGPSFSSFAINDKKLYIIDS